MTPILYIGNKNYSSWSLRPWLVLTWAGIEFEEREIDLDRPGYGERRIEQVLEVSPSGTVPVLHVGSDLVWDSLAIAEWAAEEAPDAGLWPSSSSTRAVARAVTCEMHSGFAGVRRDLPMHLHRRLPIEVGEGQPWGAATQREIGRILEIWTEAGERHAEDGPWLFGQRTIADAFYTPIAARFRTYAVSLPEAAEAYCATVLDDAAFRLWEADARAADSTDSRFYGIDRLYESGGADG